MMVAYHHSEAELLGQVLAGPEPAAAFLQSGERLAGLPFRLRRSLGVARLVTEHGIPPGHARRLAALWELAERWFLADRPTITTACDALPMLDPLTDDGTARLVVLLLDGDHTLLATECVATGHDEIARLHPRDVLVPALRAGAAAVLVARLHPGGDARPTAGDHDTFAALRRACALVGLGLVDHLVVARGAHHALRHDAPPRAQAKASSPVSALPRMRVCTSSVPS
jgi:DNA repair protein RadC